MVCKLFLSACWVWNLWCPLEWAGHQSSHSFLRLVPPLKGCHSQYLQLGMNHEDFTIAFRTCLSVSVKESKQGKKERCETQYEVCATECGGAPMTRHQETGRDKYRSELLWVWWEDCATRQPCPQFLSHFLLLKFSSYMWRDYRERGFWTCMLLEKDITVCVCIYIYIYISHIHTHSTIQKFGISSFLIVLITLLCLSCIYLIKYTEKTLIMWNIIRIQNKGFLF